MKLYSILTSRVNDLHDFRVGGRIAYLREPRDKLHRAGTRFGGSYNITQWGQRNAKTAEFGDGTRRWLQAVGVRVSSGLTVIALAAGPPSLCCYITCSDPGGRTKEI